MKAKVLLVSRPLTPPWDEGSKNFALGLAKHISSLQLSILTNKKSDEIGNKAAQIELYSGPKLNRRQRLRLVGLRKYRNKFDIIHFLFTPTRWNTRFFKLMLRPSRAKTIQTIAAVLDDKYNPKMLKNILHADQLVTYTEFSKKRLESLGMRNVVSIYPGIDLRKFKITSKNNNLAHKLGVDSEDFVVVYPGEYSTLGATDILINMMPALCKQIPKLKLVFACREKTAADSSKKKQISAKAQEMGLGDSLIHTGIVEDMVDLYNLADVVVFPVTYMQGKFDVPLVLIEAMACSRPIIVSDLPILQEYMSDDRSVAVPSGNYEALLGALGKLHSNKKLRESLGSSARRYVEQNFDIIKVAGQYEKLYEKLLDS